jgi:hypothetical protein
MSNKVGYTIIPPLWLGARPTTSNTQVGPGPITGQIFSATAENGVCIQAFRHGLIVHDFSSSPFKSSDEEDGRPVDFSTIYRPVMQRITMICLYLSCFYSAVFEHHKIAMKKMALEPSDLLHYGPNSVGGGNNPFSLHMAMIVPPSDPFDLRIISRHLVIDLVCLEMALEKFNAISRCEIESLPEMIEIVLRACEVCEDFNFSAGLIGAWAVIERLISYRWKKFIKESGVVGSRKRALDDYRTYTVAVQLEILAFNGQIDADLLSKTSEIRQARNSWMHDLKVIDYKVGPEAIETALAWIKAESGILLALPVSLQISS